MTLAVSINSIVFLVDSHFYFNIDLHNLNETSEGQENDSDSLMELMIDDFFNFFSAGLHTTVILIGIYVAFYSISYCIIALSNLT